MGGIGIWQLLIVLLLVILLFGTRRLKTLGADLGETIKGFRNSVSDIKGEDTLAHHNSLNDASHTTRQQTENKH